MFTISSGCDIMEFCVFFIDLLSDNELYNDRSLFWFYLENILSLARMNKFTIKDCVIHKPRNFACSIVWWKQICDFSFFRYSSWNLFHFIWNSTNEIIIIRLGTLLVFNLSQFFHDFFVFTKYIFSKVSRHGVPTWKIFKKNIVLCNNFTTSNTCEWDVYWRLCLE